MSRQNDSKTKRMERWLLLPSLDEQTAACTKAVNIGVHGDGHLCVSLYRCGRFSDCPACGRLPFKSFPKHWLLTHFASWSAAPLGSAEWTQVKKRLETEGIGYTYVHIRGRDTYLVLTNGPVLSSGSVLNPDDLAKTIDEVFKDLPWNHMSMIEEHVTGVPDMKTMVVAGRTKDVLARLAERGYKLRMSVAGIHFLCPVDDGTKRLNAMEEHFGGKTFDILWVW